MKLMQRILISLVGSTVAALLLISSFSLYYYSSSYDLSYQDLVVPGAELQQTKRTILKEIRKLQPFKKMLHKRDRKTGSMNTTNANSDRAAEVVLTDHEYEELIQEGELLPKRSERTRSTPGPPQEESGAARHIRECVIKRPPLDHATDSRDKFPDLIRVLPDDHGGAPPLWQNLPRPPRITMQEIHEIEIDTNMSWLERFHMGISDQDMYAENDPTIEGLLRDLSSSTIVHAEEKEGGTQLKLLITFFDGTQAMLKPMRFDRDKETEPNHFYFVDFERHNSEIAAFHLDRILGFRRCPPIIGRVLNITTEVYAVTDEEMIKTFFISPAQNVCFHGHCSYYCDTSHAICGRPDTVEGSLAAFLPPDQISGRKAWKNPWKRTYHKRRRADWETDDRYCDRVRGQPLYNNTRRLADLVDVTILDFLIGNMDRHHYETFKIFGNDSFILHLDHGRGFGKAGHDELSILAPLYQCCFVRARTLQRLLQLQQGPRPLSSLMRCSLHADPLNPVLLDPHLQALDRRLEIVLGVLRDCFKKLGTTSVLYNDPEL